MTMQITFAGTMRGQKLYHVSCDGDRFFTGTLEEVKRYILIHNEKVRERQAQHDAYLASVRAAG